MDAVILDKILFDNLVCPTFDMFAKAMGSVPDKAKAKWLKPVITLINKPKKNLWSIDKELFIQVTDYLCDSTGC